MIARRPDVRAELTWLRGAPLHRVHVSGETALDDYLTRFSYRRIEIDGGVMTSRASAHDEVARAFGFPGYYGRNWDAFRDCFGDFASQHATELVAVVWRHMDVAARAAPATAVEVGVALVEARLALDMDVFVIGAGEDFDRP